jgi:hypothetical protein
MSQNDIKTIPFFRAHSDKTDGKLRLYGGVEQHEFNDHQLLVYTLDETEKSKKRGSTVTATAKRVIVMGWLMSEPHPQTGGRPPLVDIAVISTEDYQEVMRLLRVLYPNREVTIWK